MWKIAWISKILSLVSCRAAAKGHLASQGDHLDRPGLYPAALPETASQGHVRIHRQVRNRLFTDQLLYRVVVNL